MTLYFLKSGDMYLGLHTLPDEPYPVARWDTLQQDAARFRRATAARLAERLGARKVRIRPRTERHRASPLPDPAGSDT
jgi:hypothetical protein